MRWLVDGMNVVGSRPDGWWRDRRAAMARLARELAALEEPVTVVFDGAPFELEAPSGVEVAFARRRGRDAADDEIARLAAVDPDPASLSVVTSDAALRRRVEAHGARVVGAGELLRRLG